MSDLFMPMSPEQAIKAGSDYGSGAAARQLPNFFGIGTHVTPKDEDEEEEFTPTGKRKKRSKKSLPSNAFF
jgi:hypothetical protein